MNGPSLLVVSDDAFGCRRCVLDRVAWLGSSFQRMRASSTPYSLVLTWLQMAIIARTGWPRLLSQPGSGLDDQGNAMRSAAVELVIGEAGRRASFVQHVGSTPLFFNSSSGCYTLQKTPIAGFSAVRRHFERLINEVLGASQRRTGQRDGSSLCHYCDLFRPSTSVLTSTAEKALGQLFSKTSEAENAPDTDVWESQVALHRLTGHEGDNRNVLSELLGDATASVVSENRLLSRQSSVVRHRFDTPDDATPVMDLISHAFGIVAHQMRAVVTAAPSEDAIISDVVEMMEIVTRAISKMFHVHPAIPGLLECMPESIAKLCRACDVTPSYACSTVAAAQKLRVHELYNLLQHSARRFAQIEPLHVCCLAWNASGARAEQAQDELETFASRFAVVLSREQQIDILAMAIGGLQLFSSSWSMLDWARALCRHVRDQDVRLSPLCATTSGNGDGLLILVRPELLADVTRVTHCEVTARRKMLAVATSMSICDSSFLFVMPVLSEPDTADQDIQILADRLNCDGKSLQEFDHAIWLGNFAARLRMTGALGDGQEEDEASLGTPSRPPPPSLTVDRALSLARRLHFAVLQQHDSLTRRRADFHHPLHDFTEGKLMFDPTYKFQPGTEGYELRKPEVAWPLRILHRTRPPLVCQNLSYACDLSLRCSHYRPVLARLSVDVMQLDRTLLNEVREEFISETGPLDPTVIGQPSRTTDGEGLSQRQVQRALEQYGEVDILRWVGTTFFATFVEAQSALCCAADGKIDVGHVTFDVALHQLGTPSRPRAPPPRAPRRRRGHKKRSTAGVWTPEQWLHHDISREAAETVLHNVDLSGAFLLRPSGQSAGRSSYSLSFLIAGKVNHYRITREDGTGAYLVKGIPFASLQAIVDAYHHTPWMDGMRLTVPVSEGQATEILSSKSTSSASNASAVPPKPPPKPSGLTLVLDDDVEEADDDEDDDDAEDDGYDDEEDEEKGSSQLSPPRSPSFFRRSSSAEDLTTPRRDMMVHAISTLSKQTKRFNDALRDRIGRFLQRPRHDSHVAADESVMKRGHRFLSQAISALEGRGLESEGLYRLPGTTSKVMALYKGCFEKSKAIDQVDPDFDENTVASAIKHFFRTEEPVIPFDSYHKFIGVARLPAEQQPSQLRQAVGDLPDDNRAVLRLLFGHLARVSALSSVNKMTATNLGVCFGPTLLRPEDDALSLTHCNLYRSLVAVMVENNDVIFAEHDGEADLDMESSAGTPLRRNAGSGSSTGRPGRRDSFRLASRLLSSPGDADESMISFTEIDTSSTQWQTDGENLSDRAVARFAYRASDKDELTFEEGDTFSEVQAVENGWLYARHDGTGLLGFVPGPYIESVDGELSAMLEQDTEYSF